MIVILAYFDGNCSDHLIVVMSNAFNYVIIARLPGYKSDKVRNLKVIRERGRRLQFERHRK